MQLWPGDCLCVRIRVSFNVGARVGIRGNIRVGVRIRTGLLRTTNRVALTSGVVPGPSTISLSPSSELGGVGSSSLIRSLPSVGSSQSICRRTKQPMKDTYIARVRLRKEAKVEVRYATPAAGERRRCLRGHLSICGARTATRSGLSGRSGQDRCHPGIPSPCNCVSAVVRPLTRLRLMLLGRLFVIQSDCAVEDQCGIAAIRLALITPYAQAHAEVVQRPTERAM